MSLLLYGVRASNDRTINAFPAHALTLFEVISTLQAANSTFFQYIKQKSGDHQDHPLFYHSFVICRKVSHIYMLL